MNILFPEEDRRQAPGAVSQAATATATGVLAAAGAVAAAPALLLNAAAEVIGRLAAAPGVVSSTAAAGAAAGHDLLYPPKQTSEQVERERLPISHHSLFLVPAPATFSLRVLESWL